MKLTIVLIKAYVRSMRSPSPTRLSLAVIAAALALSGCTTTSSDSPKVQVVAGLYPLAYTAEHIGGDLVDVITLTPPGGHPHDLELSAKQVADIAAADLVVYLPGAQSALDEAVAQQAATTALDGFTGITARAAEEHGHEDETADEHAAHADEAATTADPHIWLDPQNLVILGRNLADRLAAIDPTNADAYRANADTFAGEMTALDGEFTTGLATCASRDIVVSHEAFGYLTAAYGLEQIAVSGITPDAEPSPARLAAVAATVKEHGITTIFTETQVDPRIADTIAAETGARVAVLDPLESIAADVDADYASVMRANLAALRTGLDCA